MLKNNTTSAQPNTSTIQIESYTGGLIFDILVRMYYVNDPHYELLEESLNFHTIVYNKVYTTHLSSCDIQILFSFFHLKGADTFHQTTHL